MYDLIRRGLVELKYYCVVLPGWDMPPGPQMNSHRALWRLHGFLNDRHQDVLESEFGDRLRQNDAVTPFVK